MRNFSLILILFLFLAVITIIPFKIFAQEEYNNFSLKKYEFTNYNFNVNQKFNYSNYKSLKADKKFAVIKQKGSFNQAEIWQGSQSSIQNISSAVIVQTGNDNRASIKQNAGASKALINQYGFNNKAEIEQYRRYNSLRITQFGNDEKIKIKQN